MNVLTGVVGILIVVIVLFIIAGAIRRANKLSEDVSQMRKDISELKDKLNGKDS